MKQENELITIKLKRSDLKKILLKNWDLLDDDTKRMLVISELVDGGSYNGN